MDIHDRRSLKIASADTLQSAAIDPKKQVLLHTGAVLILSLLLTVADYLLENAISGTGGLGGLGKRSVLATVQSCLRLVQIAVLPFWQIGYAYVTLKISRRENTAPSDLCIGFHLLLPVLRLLLLQGALYLGIGLLSSHLGTLLLMMTPWSAPLVAATLEMMYGSGSEDAVNAAMEQMMAESAVPLMICSGIVFLALAAPFFYRFRMAQFVLLDMPEKGALHALRTSRQLMRGNAMALFKLDIHFWWFYLLDLLISVVCYADALLSRWGISLPISADFAFFASFGLYLILQLMLYWWKKNEVHTTYALFYAAVQQTRQEKPVPMPQNPPWAY